MDDENFFLGYSDSIGFNHPFTYGVMKAAEKFPGQPERRSPLPGTVAQERAIGFQAGPRLEPTRGVQDGRTVVNLDVTGVRLHIILPTRHTCRDELPVNTQPVAPGETLNLEAIVMEQGMAGERSGQGTARAHPFVVSLKRMRFPLFLTILALFIIELFGEHPATAAPTPTAAVQHVAAPNDASTPLVTKPQAQGALTDRKNAPAAPVVPKVSPRVPASPGDPPAQDIPANTLTPEQKVVRTLKDLGIPQSIRLRGMAGSETIPFGIRVDQTVVGATLRLRYTYSPSLLPELSHLKILLNGEVTAAIPLPKEQAGTEQVREIRLDTRYLSDFNELTLNLVGHYANDCEDSVHSSLWTSVSNTSQLELTMLPFQLQDDLALLPAPFFDLHDNRRLELPFVFGARPSVETLSAAATVSSWFGSLAAYRGTRFPTLLNGLPGRTAVVFVNGAEHVQRMPLPPIEGPTLAVLPHPADPNSKLLLVAGRNAAELQIAAQALVLGHTGLTGPVAKVDSLELPPRRGAYDAPRWLSANRPVQLGELVNDPAKLQVKDRTPKPVTVEVRLPPDLMIWQGQGIPIDLKYRYSQPVSADSSNLTVSINNRYLKALPLRPIPRGDDPHRVLASLRDDSSPVDADDVRASAFQVSENNELEFQFFFDYHKQGLCRPAELENLWAAVDPDSTIDISEYPHYAEMPNLAYFAKAGFPFTKYADLAETALILPESPTADDIETLLGILGHLGRSTGLPALRLQLLLGLDRLESAADKDLLLIDVSAMPEVLNRWRDRFPARIDPQHRAFAVALDARPAFRPADFIQPPPPPGVGSADFDAQGSIAAFISFESPLRRGRTVVALAASTPASLVSVLDTLDDSYLAGRVRGDLSLFRGNYVNSFQLGPRYFVGDLPLITWLWFHVSRYPVLLAVAGIAGGIFVAFLCYAALRKRADARLRGQ